MTIFWKTEYVLATIVDLFLSCFKVISQAMISVSEQFFFNPKFSLDRNSPTLFKKCDPL